MQNIIHILQRGNIGGFRDIRVSVCQNVRKVFLIPFRFHRNGLDNLRDHAQFYHKLVQFQTVKWSVAVNVGNALQFRLRFGGSFLGFPVKLLDFDGKLHFQRRKECFIGFQDPVRIGEFVKENIRGPEAFPHFLSQRQSDGIDYNIDFGRSCCDDFIHRTAAGKLHSDFDAVIPQNPGKLGGFKFPHPLSQKIDRPGRRALLHQVKTGGKSTLAAGGQTAPPVRAMEAFVAFGAAVLLHLPLPEEMPPAETFLPLLPPGVRAFALYVQAHYLYLKEEYAHSAGIVEAALAMGAFAYPISAIYLHLVAVMDYISMKQTDRAQAHLLTAWEIARPDDLIEGFGEHHGLLGAMLEAAIKPKWPEDFKKMIDITYRFSSGWRRVHNPVTGHDVADDLTTTEFAIAMLAARSWTTQEIAEHLDISANTVKKHIFEAMRKLGIKNRKDLKKYMLQ